MFEKVKKVIEYFNKHTEGHEDIKTPEDVYAEFKLKYKSLVIGFLVLNNGEWIFKYSDEFKEQDKLNPITQFPDKDKVYTNKELWPFFTIRIPGLNQPQVKEIMEEEDIDRQNEVELLERFGKETISNPYELIGAT